jgi:hypothetical protein
MPVLVACPELFLAQTPWGWNGSSIGDGRGTLGLQTRPNIHLGGASACTRFGATRRRWREGCLRAGAVTARTSAKVRISSQRDREAAGGSAQDDVIFNEPGRRSRCRAGRRREPICRGFTRQRDTAMGGITDNISCAAAGIAKPTPSLATK